MWALHCPNIYSFLTRGDPKPSHIKKVSRLSNTYKTATSNFINNSEKVMEERFIYNLANSVVKMQHILDNRVITNKEVLNALESILEDCPIDEIRAKVDAKFSIYTERR